MPAQSMMNSNLIQRVLDGSPGAVLMELAERGAFADQGTRPLRRLAWFDLLGVFSGDDLEQWYVTLQQGRVSYAECLAARERETDVKACDPSIANPLSRSEDNPFVKMQMFDELLKEIWKDIERTWADNPFLASDKSRGIMQRVLFHWCRANNPSKAASESYRQGMNELVAIVFLIVKQGEYNQGLSEGEGSIGMRLCSAEHTEPDTFTLFTKLMDTGCKFMFTAHDRPRPKRPGGAMMGGIGSNPGGPPNKGPNSAVLAKTTFVWDTLLKTMDKDLYTHLVSNEIEPQIFLLRWMRLLFCREFKLEDTLILWDAIFADAKKGGSSQCSLTYPSFGTDAVAESVYKESVQAAESLPLVDYIAVAMLRNIRGELLSMDQTELYGRLMKDDRAEGPRPIASVAVKLRSAGASAATAVPHVVPVTKALPAASAVSQAAPLQTSSKTGGPLFPRPDTSTKPSEAPPPAAGYPAGQPGADTTHLQDLTSGAAGLIGRGRCLVGAAAQSAAQTVQQKLAQPADDNVGELVRRVETAEQERDTIKKKANEFITLKKQEFQKQLDERDARIRQLEQQVAMGGAVAAGGDNTVWQQQAEQYELKIRELEQKLREAMGGEAAAGAAPPAQARHRGQLFSDDGFSAAPAAIPAPVAAPPAAPAGPARESLFCADQIEAKPVVPEPVPVPKPAAVPDFLLPDEPEVKPRKAVFSDWSDTGVVPGSTAP